MTIRIVDAKTKAPTPTGTQFRVGINVRVSLHDAVMAVADDCFTHLKTQLETNG
jgi:hypothetical protein